MFRVKIVAKLGLLAAAEAVDVDGERLDGTGSRRPTQAGITPPRPVRIALDRRLVAAVEPELSARLGAPCS